MWKFIAGSAFGFILSLYVNSVYFDHTEKSSTEGNSKKILENNLTSLPKNNYAEQRVSFASKETSSSKSNPKQNTIEPVATNNSNNSITERFQTEQNRLDFMRQKNISAENYFRAGDADKIATLASHTFENEVIDLDWSHEQQKDIENLIRQSEETYDIAPTAVECRSSRCKITISGNNTELAMHAFQAIQAAMKNGKTKLSNELMFTNNAKSGAFEFYIPRDESINMYQ